MENQSESPKAEGTSKNLLTVAILVMGLSLATWFFFYIESMPLTPPETTVVVGGWFIAVFLAKMVLERTRKKKSENR